RAERARVRMRRASSRPLMKQTSLDGPAAAAGAASVTALTPTVAPAACRKPRRVGFIGRDPTPRRSTCPCPGPAYDAAVGIRPVVLLVPSLPAAVELPRRLPSAGPGLAGLYPVRVRDLHRPVA